MSRLTRILFFHSALICEGDKWEIVFLIILPMRIKPPVVDIKNNRASRSLSGGGDIQFYRLLSCWCLRCQDSSSLKITASICAGESERRKYLRSFFMRCTRNSEEVACAVPPRIQWRYRSGFQPDSRFSANSETRLAALEQYMKFPAYYTRKTGLSIFRRLPETTFRWFGREILS